MKNLDDGLKIVDAMNNRAAMMRSNVKNFAMKFGMG